jgi:hypothetical protein
LGVGRDQQGLFTQDMKFALYDTIPSRTTQIERLQYW